LIGGLLLLVAGCRQDMHDQPKYQPFERDAFFADQRASRPLVAGVVARGHLDEDQGFYTGASAGGPVTVNPLPLDHDTLARGQERYNIYCSPCHDRVGAGEGMIVLRGYKQPPTFHSDRLRSVPDGYLFQVITNGFGTMPTYAPQVAARDRWAIIAYMRALQLSQHATLADVPVAEKAKLEGAP
jgi:mono/diheme cytochrome c family protein